MRARAVLFLGVTIALAPAAARASDSWSDPHPGIRQLVRTASGPRRIYALVIDLCHAGVSVRATQSDERERTVSSFGNLVDAEAAVNGDFFSYDDYSTTGLAIGDGARWPGTSDSNGKGLIAFGRGRAEVSPPSEVVDPPPDWMDQVVSGKRPLVRDGEAFDGDDSELCTTRHPRTAAGLSRDRRTLILAVVDGRSSRSIGMTCPQLGDLMVDLGAWDATMLDGGGSSTMWVRGDGVLNDPSDGSERVVANHLAVLAHGSGEPGSCDRSWEEAAVHGDAIGASTTTDVDGDGVADLCARSSTGLECALSNGDSFEPPLMGPGMSDEHGWDDPSNWATLRMGDLDGDGRADVCARANAGIRCWLSDGAGFPTAIDGPELSDDSGWAHPEYYGTLRMADVNGDGRDDLCARSASDFRCYPSNGAGFDAPVTLAELSNANGWNEPSRYGTIRMGDVDGDGRADLCARAAAGMRCWRSLPEGGFGPAIEGPAWSDASGWGGLPYWSTIRLVDLDGDGRADLCGRAARGIVCHLSVGDGFGETIDGPEWSDASGWADYDNASTIRFGDLDGDGDLEVCARANAGIRCMSFEGGAFATEAIVGPELSDDAGWAKVRHASTLRLVDVNGDGRADLCARAAGGIRCWPSLGEELSGSAIEGPAWSDDSGWGAARFYETLRAVTPEPRCEDAAEECNGADDDCDGEIDEDCAEPGGDGDTGSPPAAPQDAETGVDPRAGGLAGCSCRAGGPTDRGTREAVLVAVCLAALLTRSRRRCRRRTFQ